MNVLALSPHTDDVELGAGGYLAQLIGAGHRVTVVAFSTGNPHTGASAEEFRAAIDKLSNGGDFHVLLYSYETRNFDQARQEILDLLIVLCKEHSPDLVLCPSTASQHQDHQVVTAEAVRAFRCSILGYELPRSNLSFAGRVYVPLSRGELDIKLQAVACYESQAGRAYTNPDVITALARVRGLQCESEFAECFEALRIVN